MVSATVCNVLLYGADEWVVYYNTTDVANVLANFTGMYCIITNDVEVCVIWYINRFKATDISAFVQFVEIVLLLIQTHYHDFLSSKAIVVNILVGMYLDLIGSNGLKEGLPTYGVNWFDMKTPEETKQIFYFLNTIFQLCVLVICL